MTALTWTLAGLSLAGVVLNIRKRRESFAIWTATNAAWAAIDLHAGLPAQAALMATYCGLSVWGLVAWRAPPRAVPDPAVPAG
jgi:nicotinamide riboside transporter PnuC